MMAIKIILLAIFCILCACSKGDNYIATSESSKITIHAFIGNSSKAKDTVISTLDTILLNGTIDADGNSMLSNYFWNNDDFITKDFQLRAVYQKPGIYIPKFNIVDYFGDTLTDSVLIRVTAPPQIDSLHFTPKDMSEALPANDIYFAWKEIFSDDNIYSFNLNCDNGFSFDTTLITPYMQPRKLPELEICHWQVTSQNKYGVKGNSIEGDFKTAGYSGLARITGVIQASNINSSDILVTASTKNTKDTFALHSSIFDTGKIPAGNYTIKAQILGLPDYNPDSVHVTLHEGSFEHISLKLVDKVPPAFPAFPSDTLPYTQELAFPILNGGLPLEQGNISVKLDNQEVEKSIYKDSLKIQIPKYHLPICRTLSINIADAASNTTKQNLYICEKSAWAKINRDTTIANDEFLNLTYQEQNPYRLKVKYIQWSTPYKKIILIPCTLDENGYSSSKFSANVLSVGVHQMQVKTVYENGLQIFSSFNLEVTK